MTHNSKSVLRKSDQKDILEAGRDRSGLNITVPPSTQRLTLHLSLESKRKAHALALASNRTIEQVIEELIDNCPESAS